MATRWLLRLGKPSPSGSESFDVLFSGWKTLFASTANSASEISTTASEEDKLTPSPNDVEAVWRHLEDAKLQLDHAHNYVRELAGDLLAGILPMVDGEDAFGRALEVERLAFANCEKVLNRFNEVVRRSTTSNRKTGSERKTEPPPLGKSAVRGQGNS